MTQQTLSVGPEELSKLQQYEDYITSVRWERRKADYYSTHAKKCRACRSTENIHLHHHTYARLGQEKDSDLVPLCQDCHHQVHRLHRQRKGSLTRATDAFLRTHGCRLGGVPPRGKTLRKQRQKRGRRIVTPKPSRPPLLKGDRVKLTSKHVLGEYGIIVDQPYRTVWTVEMEGHPGSRVPVVAGGAVRVEKEDK